MERAARTTREAVRTDHAAARKTAQRPRIATIGNQAALRRLQPKLAIGAVDDPLEHEADAVADQVMRMPHPDLSISTASPRIGRTCSACEEEGDVKAKLQMRPATTPTPRTGVAPDIVHQVLRAPGRPLDRSVRSFFEPRFGRDFSDVRVHTGAAADASARAVGALAYAAGNHLVFSESRFQPATPEGGRLLAHELTHTLQQRTAAPDRLRRDAANAAELDNEYNTAVHMGDWQAAAEWLNGFSHEDIQARLAALTTEQIADLHRGAVDNPHVGPNSQVAQLTEPGLPAASTPPPAADTAPPAPPAAPVSRPAPVPSAKAKDATPAAGAQPGSTENSPADAGSAKADATVAPDGGTAATAHRDEQVACVVRLGGCASSRDGGIPSTDNIQSYNNQCRNETQYNGSDITPTDDECRNPPQAPAAPSAAPGEMTTGEKVAIGVLIGVLAVGAVAVLVLNPELIPAALAYGRGAIVAVRLTAAVAGGVAGSGAADVVVVGEIASTSVEAAPAIAEAGGAAVRSLQVVRVLVQAAPQVAQASAPAATIAVTSSAPTIAQAAVILGSTAAATTLSSDSETPENSQRSCQETHGLGPCMDLRGAGDVAASMMRGSADQFDCEGISTIPAAQDCGGLPGESWHCTERTSGTVVSLVGCGCCNLDGSLGLEWHPHISPGKDPDQSNNARRRQPTRQDRRDNRQRDRQRHQDDDDE